MRRYSILLSLIAMMLFVAIGCEREELDATAVAPASEGAVEAQDKSDKSDQYRVQVMEAEPVAGEFETVFVQVLPGPNLEINLEFPWAVRLGEVEGLEFEPPALQREDLDLSVERAQVPVRLKAAQAGVYEVEARADFSVCNDDRCDILRDEPLSFTVRVQ